MTSQQSHIRRTKITAGVAFFCALIQTVFQTLLAVGVPLGFMAYGGFSSTLSVGLRVNSGIAAVIYLWFADVLYQIGDFRRGRSLSNRHYSDKVCRGVVWFLCIFMYLGAILNWASPSLPERYTWGPFTLVCATSCLILIRQFPKTDIASVGDSASAQEKLAPSEDDALVGNR